MMQSGILFYREPFLKFPGCLGRRVFFHFFMNCFKCRDLLSLIKAYNCSPQHTLIEVIKKSVTGAARFLFLGDVNPGELFSSFCLGSLRFFFSNSAYAKVCCYSCSISCLRSIIEVSSVLFLLQKILIRWRPFLWLCCAGVRSGWLACHCLCVKTQSDLPLRGAAGSRLHVAWGRFGRRECCRSEEV